MSVSYELGYYSSFGSTNLATNGTFDSDTGWTKGNGWTIASGVAHSDGTQASADLSQDQGLVTNRIYRVTFTVSNYVSGEVRPRLGPTGAGTSRSANGTYEEDIVATGSVFALEAINYFEGDIDDVTVYPLELVTLYPEFDLWKGEEQVRTETRARSGRLRVYKWYDYDRIKFGAEWVPASDAALVNSWWDSNADLLFFVTSDSVSEVHSVMIMNDETPLAAYNKPYNNYYKGKIELEGY